MAQHLAHHHLRRARRAVRHLEADAEAMLRQRAAIDAFGADLDRGLAGDRAHQLGAEAVGAGDHEGIGHHRLEDAMAGGGALLRQMMRVGHLRHREGGVGDRHRDHRDAAAVDAARHVAQLAARHLLQDAEQALLHRMLVLDIALGPLADMHGGRQEPGMLAAAIVVRACRLAARAQHRLHGRLVRRPVRAAFQILDAEPDAMQPARHRLDMARLGIVRGGGERDLRGAELEAVGRARFHQRDGEQRLDRGAAIDRQLDIAPRVHDAAMGIHHRDAGVMAALHHPAAHHLGEDRRGILRQIGLDLDAHADAFRTFGGTLPPDAAGCKAPVQSGQVHAGTCACSGDNRALYEGTNDADPCRTGIDAR